MNKKYNLIIILIMIMIMLTGCVKEIKIEYDELHAELMWFDDNNEQFKNIPEDIILMNENEEFDEFNNEYFIERGITIDLKDDDKAELAIQIPSYNTTYNSYGITNICKKGNKMIVTLKNSGTSMVDKAESLEGEYKWVIIAEVDKTYLSDNMELIVKKEWTYFR